MATLLIVHHSPTDSVRELTDAVVAGARNDEIEGVDVVVRAALDPDSAELLAADGVVLVTPANFGYMSGALKHYLDTVFLEAGGALADDGGAGDGSGGRRLPFGLVVHGRYDTTGAERSVLAIVQALNWRQSADVLSILGDVGEEERSAAYELGATLAVLALESEG